MDNQLLLTLLLKNLEERLSSLPDSSPLRGPRGQRGRDGRDGESIRFSDHVEQFRSWAKEFALKLEDLSEEQIKNLRGPRGQDGRSGKDFVFEEQKENLKDICRQTVNEISDSLKLKFSDLTEEEINKLRGPRGQDGANGKDFELEEHRESLLEICRQTVNEISDSLKLKFSDLSEEEIQNLRGPRGRDGRDGRDGKDFVFEEHKDFFESLKLKFSDLTEEEIVSLKLKFSDLSEEDKNSLKLKFSDLSDDDRLSLRGPRGQRGQRGRDGADGKDGLPGRHGRDGKSVVGRSGRDGVNGRDGQDGKDAAYITDIRVDEIKPGEIVFIFDFSDGTSITTNEIDLPVKKIPLYTGGGGSGMGSTIVVPGEESPDIIDASGATVTATDNCIIYSNPSAAQEIFLPAASDDQKVTIKFLTDFTVTITPDNVSETIDGETNIVTNSKYSAINLRSKDGIWFIF